jgi:glutamine synthetase
VLPTSLGEALDALAEDDVILSALGPHISDSYLGAKQQEFDEYNRQVTSWEIERYINRY